MNQVFKQPSKVAPNFVNRETDSKAAEDSTKSTTEFCDFGSGSQNFMGVQYTMNRSPCSRISQNFVLSKQLSFRRYPTGCFFNIEITLISKGSAIGREDLKPMCAVGHYH